MKSANILKLNKDDFLLYPKRIVKDSGSFPTLPYIFEHKISHFELAKKLKDILEFSSQGLTPPEKEETLFYKDILKITEKKNLKEFHNESLLVNIFTKDEDYNICPNINKGSRLGFHGTKDRIIIPINSSIDELAEALKEAFEKSS